MNFLKLAPLALIALMISACQPSLEHQPKIGVLEEPRSDVEGTVAYAPHAQASAPVTRVTLMRGKERYEIYCAVCHGFTGAGNGLATQRGFGAPLSFFASGVNKQTTGEIETIIRKGKGRMYAFADRIAYDDRFAIAAYTQVLALRSHFPAVKLSADDRRQLSQEAK